MKIYPLLIAALVMSITVAAQDQCIDGFAKLYPEPTTDYSLDFGYSVSMHGNLMAVGVPDSDTLSRESGIVYIYEKTQGSWIRIASMVASEAIPDLQLGISVKLVENYLFASASAGGGSVYVYRKPPTGWTTTTETTIIAVEGTQAFGVAYHHPVDLSEDENTLVVADAMKPHNSNPISIAGSIFVFHKSAGVEWTSDITPTEIKATTNMIDLGRTGTYVRGRRIFTGAPFTNSGSGNLFVYYDASGDFSNPVLEASLSGVSGGGFWMDNMVVTDAGIFVSGRTPASGLKIYFYPRPTDNIWTDVSPSCLIDPDGDAQTQHYDFIRLGSTSAGLFAIFPGPAGVSLATLTEGATGWCNPSVEIIETRITSRYGTLIAAGELGDVVTGFVSHPSNSLSQSALKAYSKGSDNVWTSSLIYSTAKSTRGHAYGHSLAVHNDLMFVGAPLDNTVIDRGGKVYVYQQSTPESPLVKIATLRAPVFTQFGKGLATNGEYLAVGAHVGEPAKILIYRKGTDGWTNPEFSQVIEVPTGGLAEPTYGETVAMDERWLLIPFVDWRGFSTVSVAVYELADEAWTYRQTLETDYTGIFTGTPNAGVAISGSVIVAANRVYELNNDGEWIHACTLSPSDPERFRLNFPYFEMLSNGSNFGRSVAIYENTIAIGAPRRDSETGVWDVGAVYVYTREANQNWTNRYETVKIVPKEINASSLFGWDVAFVENALIIGAPTASTFAKPDPNQSPKNNAVGKVYLYQPEDPSWKKASLSKIFAGETSFRDNFGVEVAYSAGRIFIGSSEEDISTGRTSGSVYVADAPPIIGPVGPLCVDDAVITLTSTQPGGVWSGPGITNGTSGEFDPSVAGPGVHEVTYVSGICQRSAKLNLLVSSRVHAQIDGPAEVLICAAPVEFDRSLSAVATPGASFEWEHRSSPEGEFVSIPYQWSLELVATQRGEYRIHLFNNGCEGYSDTLAIRDEVVEIVLDSPGEVCGAPNEGLALSAAPEGGVWWGSGVVENRFLFQSVANGTYVLNYQYISALGCVYSDETTVTVKRIPQPSIRREGSLCETGVVTQTIVGEPIDGVTYTWSYQPLEGGDFVEVGSGISYEATNWGWYKLTATKGDCRAESHSRAIDDSFSSTLSPAEETAELCHDHEVLLSFPVDEFSTFDWHYSADGQSTMLLTEDGNSLRPDKTGYYTGTIHRGICTFTAPTKFFYVHPKDSVFIPNVFTPNGDGKNDSFNIMVLYQDGDPADGDPQDIAYYDVYNRYGRKVFTAPQNQPWTGADSESAVYFWLGTYYSCKGEPRTARGWVHLVK
jgi:hypothetical protein